MRTSAFVIMMLLTTALSSTMARTVREAMIGTPRQLGGSLMTSPHEAINGKHMVTEMSHGADFTSESQGPEAAQSGLNTEDSDNIEWATMKCLSKEFCKEKKVICSKICKENNGVETQHLPEKCFFKCKKCIPTC
ncbi:hypothetical protein M5K25_026259 [Dendrobium thyrsiflorum]|uniref:Uncharacterized protein n=1 Tax=Dendrobium thyrsiflorum TaxID=117978 RepID=A0ABD0TWZ1_DENTH